MSNESVFSTKREQTQTASQMLENAIKRKTAQRANTIALTEAKRLSESSSNISATMESTDANIEENIKKASTLESLAYTQGSKNIAKNQLQMRNRLIQEGTEYVYGQVLGDLIFESYWLDTPVKEASVEQIEESINDLFTFIEENYADSKVPSSKQSRLLENINNVVNNVVKEAVERILEEAKENNEAFTEFSLSDAEEDELDDKLCDLGKDEIVEIIKNKVAQVVQDEKEKGEEKSKMFEEIEASLQDSDDKLTDAEEAMLVGLNTGEITLEGTTIDAFKVAFSAEKKEAKSAYNAASRYMKRKKYKEAANEYAKAKKLFSDMLRDVKDLDDDTLSDICSWLVAAPIGHFFIASIGGPARGVAITQGICFTLGNLFGIGLPLAIMQKMATNEENLRKAKDAGTSNYYKTYIIQALDLNIDACEDMIRKCNSKSRERKSVKEAMLVGLNNTYSPSERQIISLLESGADFNLQLNTSDGDLKAFVSALCKKIHETLMHHEYGCALVLMNELENKLSDVPETISADVKGFVLSMINMVYGAIPADEIIISRIGTSMGSPDMNSNSPIIDMISISWMDVLVNIKTNFGSIKDYCTSKIDGTDVGIYDTFDTQKEPATLQSMIASNQNRLLNNSMGSSIFESLMMMNLSNTSKMVTEAGTDVSDDNVEDAALIESLLQYTVLETLDTLGIYKFRLMDINSLKKTCMNAVSEGTAPVYGESDKKTVGVGSDEKTGKKKIRINTRKMKQKN